MAKRIIVEHYDTGGEIVVKFIGLCLLAAIAAYAAVIVAMAVVGWFILRAIFKR